MPDVKQTSTPAPDKQVPFSAVRQSGIVMRGKEFIACARSHTMAKRIANALNLYKPNDRGE